MSIFPPIHALEDAAGLSECGTFRWWLTRSCTADGISTLFSPARNPPLVVCMLNPSTADATTNDQTIRKLIAFARALDRRGLVVVNCYAFRARHPRDLLTADDPVGWGNMTTHGIVADLLQREWGDRCPLVCAWGKLAPPDRVAAVVRVWTERGIPLTSWGRNGDGSPPHPLYLPLSTPLEPWGHR